MAVLSCRLITVISRVFGQQDMEEKKIMRRTVYVFVLTACVRLIDLIIVHVEEEKIADLFAHPSDYNILLITVWAITDLVPIVFLYKVHFQNFITFEG